MGPLHTVIYPMIQAPDVEQLANPMPIRSAAATVRERRVVGRPGMGPRELLAEYERRLAGHDFDAVAPLISTEAIFWFNDGSHRGMHAIRKAFEQTFAALPDERYWLEDVTWL